MLKVNLCQASMSLALSAIVCVAGTTFGQDGSNAKSSGKKPVSVKTIRPFTRTETPANQAPDLYDASSDEFNYFREDLGRQEMSTRQRQRLEQIASRVVYDDPMDKPAADGSPFVDIYSLDEVIADGAPYEGLDDPDNAYAADENNLLAKIAESCGDLTTTLQILTGATSSVDNSGKTGTGASSGMMVGSGGTPFPMPEPTMAPVMMEDGRMMGGPGASGEPAAKPEKKDAAPSKKDDSALIFPDGEVANPFEGKAEAAADFDFFKADRDFAPKDAPAQNGMTPMGFGGMMGPGSMPPMMGPEGTGK